MTGPGDVLGDARSRGAAVVHAGPRRRSSCRCRPPAASPRRSTCPAIRPTCTSRPGSILRRTSANGRTTIEATLDAGHADRGVVVHARQRAAERAAARRAAALRREVDRHDRRRRRAAASRSSNVTIVQGEPSQIDGHDSRRLRGRQRQRRVARAHRERRPAASRSSCSDPALRRHQFLVSLERAARGGSFTLETGFPTLPAAQRETGEVAVEGLGTLEVDVAGDARAAADGRARSRSVARRRGAAVAARGVPLPAHRATTPPSLDARRHAASPTPRCSRPSPSAPSRRRSSRREGRALTEVTLWIRNRAQPFMKVALPPGASMLSVEVAGSPAKPVEGKDGSRVPLLRPGLPAGRPLRRVVRLSPRRDAVREEGRHADDAAEDGRPGQRASSGSCSCRIGSGSIASTATCSTPA